MVKKFETDPRLVRPDKIEDGCICHETVVGKDTCPVHGPHPSQVKLAGVFKKCKCSMLKEHHFHFDSDTVMEWDKFQAEMLKLNDVKAVGDALRVEKGMGPEVKDADGVSDGT